MAHAIPPLLSLYEKHHWLHRQWASNQAVQDKDILGIGLHPTERL